MEAEKMNFAVLGFGFVAMNGKRAACAGNRCFNFPSVTSTMSFYGILSDIEQIKDMNVRLQALDYADSLEKKYVSGEKDDTLKGQLGAARVQALMSQWVSEHVGSKSAPPRPPVKRRKKQSVTPS